MLNDTALCIVYLGREIPKYIEDNLKYLKKTFPGFDVYFITDNKSAQERVSKFGIKTWRCPSPSTEWKSLKDIDGVDSQFRDGFWIKTIGRIYALLDFSAAFPDRSIIQIEGDVWLSPHFPFEAFTKIDKPIAFPLERRGVGIMSTLYLQNYQATKMIFDFFDSSIRGEGHLVDMHILGDFAEKNKNLVKILPSAVNVAEMFNDSADEDFRIQISEFEGYFGGLFDASTWGQYLTGLDPRNFLGIKILYHLQISHAVNPINSRIQLLDNGALEIIIDGVRTKLFSMHIHSKDRRIFRNGSETFIRKRLYEKTLKRKYEVSPKDLFTSFNLRIFFSFIKIILIKKFK